MTSSAEDSPAKTSVWLDRRKGLAGSRSSLLFPVHQNPQHSTTSLVSYRERCRDYSVQAMEETLRSSSLNWESGGIGSPTGFLTVSTGESHSGAVGCTLSDILEAHVHPKYVFEPESLRGHSAAVQETQAHIANSLRASSGSRGTDDPDRYPAYIPVRADTLQGSQLSRQSNSPDGHGAYIPEPHCVNARQTPITGKPSLDTQGHSHAVAARIAQPLRANRWGGSDSHGDEGNVVVSPASDANRVRETPRLPGRLDTPDGPRYAALGDAVTVSVAEWIGQRIMASGEKMQEERRGG